MTTWRLLASTWSWDPSVLVGCVALIGGYLVVVRSRITSKMLFFVTGVLVMLLALESPLEELGDTYLFSAHMAQHLLLILVVPPLMLLGIPRWLAQRILDWPLANRIEQILNRPLPAWLLGMGTIWVWHAPALYNATLTNENIHIVEHVCFLVTSTIFWWPVLSPLTERRLAPLATIPYLFAASAATSILGIILTFTPPGIYPAYLDPNDEIGALPLLRDGWGLSPATDQQLGGLLMWVPGGLAYLSGIIGALARWYSSPEEDEINKAPESLGESFSGERYV
jgi:cytochrome c oxidase assembly factor CtaG